MDGTKRLNDDIWIHCFCFLNIRALFSIQSACHYFYTLTDHTKQNLIHQHWKMYCQQLCTNVKTTNIDCKDWKQFFQHLLRFLIHQKYISRDIDNYNCPTVTLKKLNASGDIAQAIRMDNVSIFDMMTKESLNGIGRLEFGHLLVDITQAGAINIFEIIITQSQYINQIDATLHTGNTLLSEACLFSDTDNKTSLKMVQMLLNHPNMKKPNINFGGKTVLHHALSLKSMDVLNLLLNDKRLDVNCVCVFEGNILSPVEFAIQIGNYNAAKVLIQSGRTDLILNHCETDFALSKGQDKIAKLIEQQINSMAMIAM